MDMALKVSVPRNTSWLYSTRCDAAKEFQDSLPLTVHKSQKGSLQ